MGVPDPAWSWRSVLHNETLDASGHHAGAGAVAASAVSVLDTAGFFTGTNVETVLAELALKDIGYLAHGNTGSTETFDALTGWHSATLNAATVTFTFTGATSGLVAAMVLELAQDGTGGRLVAWPGSVVWPGGTAPTLSTAAAAVDVLTFFSRDGGTTWYGFPTGGSSGSALTAKDEGSTLDTAVTSFDFTGAGVTATNVGHAITVAIPGVSSVGTDGLIEVYPGAYSVAGDPPTVTVTSVWGVSGGVPYYDASNVVSGEEAALYYNPVNDEFVLIPYGF